MEWRNRRSPYFVHPERFAAGITGGIAIAICYERFSCFRSKPSSCLDWLYVDVSFLSGPDINSIGYLLDLRSSSTVFDIIQNFSDFVYTFLNGVFFFRTCD